MKNHWLQDYYELEGYSQDGIKLRFYAPSKKQIARVIITPWNRSATLWSINPRPVRDITAAEFVAISRRVNKYFKNLDDELKNHAHKWWRAYK